MTTLRTMAAASSLTMVAVASGFGLSPRTDQYSHTCSAFLSTPGAGKVLPLHVDCTKRLQSTSGMLFGNSLLANQNQRVVYSQPTAPAPAVGVRASATGTVTKEAVTGIEFSNTVTSFSGATTELTLVGTGVREKQIAFLKVKVYAVGFYIDTSFLADSPIGKFKGKSGSDLSKDEAFFKALIEAPVGKALKIVLARDIEGSQFWGALDEALTPRLKALGAGSAGQEDLASFGNVFRDRALKQGTTVLLTWCQPSSLLISISSPQASSNSTAPDASIDSAPLLSSLFDVYLGQDPVSPSAKASVASGFPSLL